VEGCLDINATNFDVEADRACADCCTYPNLRLSVQHNFSDTFQDTSYRFNLDSIYTLDSINFFFTPKVKFYLSDIQLIIEDGNTFGVESELEIAILNTTDTITIEDNFALINRAVPSTQTIGDFSKNGAFRGISFNIGFSDTVQAATPQFFKRNHPLSLGDSSLYDFDKQQYIITQFSLVRDAFSMESDTVQIDILANEFYEKIELDFPFNIRRGFDTTIFLEVDYRKWLRGVNIKEDDELSIKEQLKNNMVNAFQIVDIRSTN